MRWEDEAFPTTFSFADQRCVSETNEEEAKTPNSAHSHFHIYVLLFERSSSLFTIYLAGCFVHMRSPARTQTHIVTIAIVVRNKIIVFCGAPSSSRSAARVRWGHDNGADPIEPKARIARSVR